MAPTIVPGISGRVSSKGGYVSQVSVKFSLNRVTNFQGCQGMWQRLSVRGPAFAELRGFWFGALGLEMV